MSRQGWLRLLWLVVAWPAPAVIAGAAGWTGIWGSGSAFLDYLIPIPVAGGALHVPTFLVATAVVFANLGDSGEARNRSKWLGPVLLGVALIGVAMLVDLERVFRALTTDAVFRLRVSKNPLALFVTTDAGLAFLWTHGVRVSPRLVAAVALPAAFVGIVFLGLSAIEPELRAGLTLHGDARGDQMRWVYTKQRPLAEIDDALLAYAEESAPERNVNAEDIAFYFTSSATAAREGRDEGIFATVCLYEDGTGPVMDEGRIDCFAHESFSDLRSAGRLDLAEFCPGLAPFEERWPGGRADLAACRGRANRR